MKFTGWHKSSYSGSGENCVDQGIDQQTGIIGVRDTKVADSPIVGVSTGAWTAFVQDLKVNDTLAGGVIS